MEELIIKMIPSIANQPTLLILVSVLYYMFFGSILFSWLRKLLEF